MMFTVPGGPQIQFLWNHVLQIRAEGCLQHEEDVWWSRRRRDLQRKAQQNSAGCWQQFNHIRQGARERRGDCHRSCAAREVCERRDDARIPRIEACFPQPPAAALFARLSGAPRCGFWAGVAALNRAMRACMYICVCAQRLHQRLHGMHVWKICPNGRKSTSRHLYPRTSAGYVSCTCIHTCIHTYIHTYMYACIHTYILCLSVSESMPNILCE